METILILSALGALLFSGLLVVSVLGRAKPARTAHVRARSISSTRPMARNR